MKWEIQKGVPRFVTTLAILFVLATPTRAQFTDPIDANDPWPVESQNQRNTGLSPSEAPFDNLEVRWSFQLPPTPFESHGSSPIIVYGDANGDGIEERVLITGRGNTVYAINAQDYTGGTPEVLWKYQFSGGQDLTGRFAGANLYADSTTGATQKSILFTAHKLGGGSSLFAIPITPTSPLDANGVRTDSPTNSGGALHWEAMGGPTGFTVLNLDNAQLTSQTTGYKSLILHSGNDQATILAIDGTGEGANVQPGDVAWTVNTGGFGSYGTTPALGSGQTAGEKYVYFTGNVGDPPGEVDTRDGVWALKIDADRLAPSGPEWSGEINVFPDDAIRSAALGITAYPNGGGGNSGQILSNGSYAGPVVGDAHDGVGSQQDRIIYVPADNGVIYALDRDQAGSSGADKYAGVNDAQGNDEGRHIPTLFCFLPGGCSTPQDYVYHYGRSYSATPALMEIDGKNLLVVADENGSVQALEHTTFADQGTIHSAFDNRLGIGGTGADSQGGVTLDAAGRVFFDGAAYNPIGETGSLDFTNLPALASEGFGDATVAQVMPIDVDGTIYVVGDSGTIYALRNSYMLGDMNYDGVVNNDDLPGMNAALLGLTQYADYVDIQAIALDVPAINYWYGAADVNEDGIVNNDDIPAFVALLTGGSQASGSSIPEPTTIMMAVLGGLVAASWRRGVGRDAAGLRSLTASQSRHFLLLAASPKSRTVREALAQRPFRLELCCTGRRCTLANVVPPSR